MANYLNNEVIESSKSTLDLILRKKKSDSFNSNTSKIFHMHDRSMKNGKVAFKPLQMETVPEEIKIGLPAKITF